MQHMRFNLIILILLLFTCPLSLQAKALVHNNHSHIFYLTWEGGYGQRSSQTMGNGRKSFEPGTTVGVALGYFINPAFSVEAEFENQVAALNKVTDTLPGPLTAEELSHQWMLNGTYHFWRYHQLMPYIGAGLGLGVVAYSLHVNRTPPPSMQHLRKTYTNFAYQVMAGINYAITNDLLLGIEYRHIGMPTIHYPNRKASLAINNGLVKVTYLFNQTSKSQLKTSPRHNPYLAVEGGISFRKKEGFGPGGTKSLHEGPFMGVAYGYVLNPYLRGEAEISFRQNEVKRIQLPPVSGNAPSGDEQTVAGMLNVYLTPGVWYHLSPYVGIGGGYAYTTYALHLNLPPSTVGVPPILPPFSHHNRGHSSNLAYQSMLGVNYHLSNDAELGVEYRYFRVKSITYRYPTGRFITTNFTAHTAIIRFMYLFGAV